MVHIPETNVTVQTVIGTIVIRWFLAFAILTRHTELPVGFDMKELASVYVYTYIYDLAREKMNKKKLYPLHNLNA